jgi:hypothetical protein
MKRHMLGQLSTQEIVKREELKDRRADTLRRNNETEMHTPTRFLPAHESQTTRVGQLKRAAAKILALAA